MDKSAKTARVRTTLSRPMSYLHRQGLLVGNCLDYGCGRGFDATFLCIAKYDPYWYSNKLVLSKRYDTVTCNYVLNVIADERERNLVIKRITSLLKRGGKAYITVRADVKVSGLTNVGTWQGNIFLTLPLIKSTGRFRMYLLAKHVDN